MERKLFSEEHALFRRSFRAFVGREVKPHQERWWRAGQVDREVWRKAGESGFLCPWLSEAWGGPGGDFLHSCVVIEELAAAYETGFALSLHSDIVAPYLFGSGSEEQKRKFLVPMASGERVGAIAMTEPGTGSDLSAIQTRAVRDGDHYVLNGSKTFISNGQLCDLVIVAARTDDREPRGGLSLFVVETDSPGFVRGKKLQKLGLHSQDTSEMHFTDCRVPVANRIGEEGSGFAALTKNLQQERLVVAVGAQASAETVLADTLVYVRERRVFGKALAELQNTRFELADCATKVEVGRHFLDRLIEAHLAGESLIKECSMAKLYQTDMLCEVVDRCLQLFGGYGYMLEYPVCRAYADARVQRIFAGTNEIMKVIIARQMGL